MPATTSLKKPAKRPLPPKPHPQGPTDLKQPLDPYQGPPRPTPPGDKPAG